MDLTIRNVCPPHFVERIYTLLKRLCRLLLSNNIELIVENLAVLDAFLALGIEKEQLYKRSVDIMPHESTSIVSKRD